MFLYDTSYDDVHKVIDKMATKTSCGIDEISRKVIKRMAPYISVPLSYIFNLTFTTGKIPDDLKVALVTPVYKASEENIYSNYRPISVLPCFSKILEKLMYTRLIDYIHKNGILTDCQYGFRSNVSTNYAIIELVDKITKAIENNEFTVGIFREFVHDGYYLATVAHFVHQAFVTRNEGTTDESKNVSDGIGRSNLICAEKILFLTDHNVS